MAMSLRVLIVEDVEDDALVLVQHLGREGYDVTHERVDTAEAMRAALKEKPWDVILCDYRLPAFSVPEAQETLKDAGADIPLLVVSGTIGEKTAADLMRSGAQDMILKDELARLVPAIERERKAAEERRAKSSAGEALNLERRLLHNLIANVPDAIYFKDRDHRYIRLNEAEARVLNAASVEAVIGKAADDFITKERARIRHEEEEQIFATGEPLVGRVEKAPQKDGTSRWYSATKAPIRDERGATVGLVGITRDVTRMKRAEEALRQSEAFFRAIVDYAPGALVIKDLDGRNLLANKEFCSWYATPAINVIGKTHDQFLSKEASERVAAQERKVLETKTLVREERRVAYPDGESRDVLVQKFPILGDDGEMRALGTLLINITKRRKAEEAVLESEERFKDFAMAASDWFWETDADMRFTYISEQYQRVSGQDPAAALGKTRQEFAGADPDDDAWNSHLADLAARHPFHDFTYPVKGSDGAVRYIRTSGVPFFDQKGSFRGYRGTATDVTRLKATEQQLQQVQKMETVGNLTGGIAHDFNNILGVALGNLQLLKRRVKEDERLSSLIQSAVEAIHHGADLTKQLLAFSRRQELEPQVLDVNELVGGMDRMLRRTLGEQVEIETALGEIPGQVKADPAQLEAAILNLAVNARDAMPEGGRLMIATENADLDEAYVAAHPYVEAGPHTCISVCDTGPGIPEEIRERIFEPFFTTKDVGKGTGLGLSMVYGFVKQSGGHINVYCENGHGTRFRIYLPRSDEVAVPITTEKADIEELPKGTETVLLVEDDERFRRTAALLLEDLGYTVVSEADGPSGLKALDHVPNVDLLFTDMIMPGGMNGHQLAERAKERRPELAVLLASGYPRDAFSEGRKFKLLSKPYTDQDLARTVRRVLDGRKMPEN